MNKSKLISSIFFLFSIVLLSLWFNYYYETRKIEREITKINKNIKVSKEFNKVLLSEYAAHTNPEYLDQLANVYLDYNIINEDRTAVFNKNDFFNKLHKESLIIPVYSKNNYKKK